VSILTSNGLGDDLVIIKWITNEKKAIRAVGEVAESFYFRINLMNGFIRWLIIRREVPYYQKWYHSETVAIGKGCTAGKHWTNIGEACGVKSWGDLTGKKFGVGI